MIQTLPVGATVQDDQLLYLRTSSGAIVQDNQLLYLRTSSGAIVQDNQSLYLCTSSGAIVQDEQLLNYACVLACLSLLLYSSKSRFYFVFSAHLFYFYSLPTCLFMNSVWCILEVHAILGHVLTS